MGRVRTLDALTVLGPEDGEYYGSPFDLTIKATAAETGGWGVVVVTGVPGEGGQTHVHRGEAEAFFILKGAIELLGAESTTPLSPGSFVLIPPDTEHGLRIVGDGQAAWLAIWPRALDGYPEAYLRLEAKGASEDDLTELARMHGVLSGRTR